MAFKLQGKFHPFKGARHWVHILYPNNETERILMTHFAALVFLKALREDASNVAVAGIECDNLPEWMPGRGGKGVAFVLRWLDAINVYEFNGYRCIVSPHGLDFEKLQKEAA